MGSDGEGRARLYPGPAPPLAPGTPAGPGGLHPGPPAWQLHFHSPSEACCACCACWAGLQGRQLATFEPNSLTNHGLAVSGDGRFIAVASFTAEVKVKLVPRSCWAAAGPEQPALTRTCCRSLRATGRFHACRCRQGGAAYPTRRALAAGVTDLGHAMLAARPAAVWAAGPADAWVGPAGTCRCGSWGGARRGSRAAPRPWT